MANTSVESRLAGWRMAVAGAGTLTLLFVLCWGAAAAGLPAAHMWISLFTTAPVASAAALGEGVLWSVVFGALSGAALAFFYNGFGARRA